MTGARPKLDDKLISSSDIADMAGANLATVSNWKKRHPGFPEPAYTSKRGNVRLYWRDEIETWLIARTGDVEETAADMERRAQELAERAANLRRMAGA
jgi:phage terminase Nu1 subunit (DNA packaging protein)